MFLKVAINIFGTKVLFLSKQQIARYGFGEIFLLDQFNEIKSLSNAPRKFNFGYVGRVDVAKGFHRFIEIANQICQEEEYTVCANLLIWSKSEAKLAQRLATSQISMQFTAKSGAAAPYYNNIDVLLLPYVDLSSTVAIPFVVLEALSAGCKVIVPDFISHTLVDSGYRLAENLITYPQSNYSKTLVAELCIKTMKELNQQKDF